MQHHILITRPIPESAISALRAAGHNVVVRQSHKAPTPRELRRLVAKAPYTILVSFLTDTIDARIFDAVPTLRLVANYAVGFNNIAIEEARLRGIAVTNTQGTSGNAVAETTVALMLALTTRIVEGDRFVRAKKFKGWDPYLLLGTDLAGKIIGLVGAGEIGSIVAKRLIKGFECTVLYYDVRRNEVLDALGATFVSKEEIFRTADIISLHVPLLPETTHLINETTLGLMKKEALLINTARGPVVDETALVSALQSGRIAGAALDVYEFEPKVARTLRKLNNTVLTPHIASARTSVREAMAKKVVENINAFSEGASFKNIAA